MATEMQKRAALDTLENVGRERPKSKKEILTDAGYSPAIAKNPDIVFESKGFQELLNEVLPDDLLLRKHLEGLDAVTHVNEIVDRDSKGAPIYSLQEVTDYSVRHKYLNTAYQLKGRHKKEDEQPKTITNNLTQIIINAPSHASEDRDKSNSETVPSVASTTGQ